jgi:hypothetical protein
VADCTGLENRHVRKGIVSSNLTLSARLDTKPSDSRGFLYFSSGRLQEVIRVVKRLPAPEFFLWDHVKHRLERTAIPAGSSGFPKRLRSARAKRKLRSGIQLPNRYFRKRQNMPVITANEYADIASKCKKAGVSGRFRPSKFAYSTAWIHDGFAGCCYVDDAAMQCVVAFKGTGGYDADDSVDGAGKKGTIVRDLVADLKLSLGIVPNQASTAKTFFKQCSTAYPGYDLTVVGHSLGGYLTQVVSYWYGVNSVTFNAPGAWGDLQKACINMFKPQVMWRTIKAHGRDNGKCVNFIHVGDVVGNFGMHRGETFRVNGVSHAMKAIQDTIFTSTYGVRDPFSL